MKANKVNTSIHHLISDGYFCPRGKIDSALYLYEKHEECIKNKDYLSASEYAISFEILGCFAIELAIKDLLIGDYGKTKNEVKGHDIYLLLSKLKSEDKELYNALVKYVNKNKGLCVRTQQYSFEFMIKNLLNSFTAAERYAEAANIETDASVVLLFVSFFKENSKSRELSSRDEARDTKYISLDKLFKNNNQGAPK